MDWKKVIINKVIEFITEDVLKWLRKHIFVTLLSGGGGSIILFFWDKIGNFLLIALDRIINFFSASILIPFWIFIPACILIVLFIISSFRNCLRANRQPSWRSYTTDNFEGLKWTWKYDEGGRIYRLTVLCPQCSLQLRPTQEVLDYNSYLSTVFYCEKCRKRIADMRDLMGQIEDRVERYIVQKVHTNTWQKKDTT